ncbi:hypothetical protein SAMN05421854_1011367 [Amycolatopsis rubida]|uniref:Uncharacterized protein n=2 Tax=Amycolatopsis rubida TaxID=112413 RepID=A0A1I5FZR1_9PSEU|nr:hypothetical protein [Amycolatopsis rubida]SFO29265.1 hypothetical protein SAMN05421854_1011367 [Amycolatopsis rubida]
MTEGTTSPAMRYKEIVGLARGSADSLRAWELARADEIERQLADAHAAVAAAQDREEKTRERANRWWKMALHNVSRLSFVETPEDPQPVTTARPQYLDRYLEEVKPSYQELVQAVLGLGWRAKR